VRLGHSEAKLNAYSSYATKLTATGTRWVCSNFVPVFALLYYSNLPVMQ